MSAPRYYWKTTEVAQLRRLVASGLTARQAAEAMGIRLRVVQGAMHRNGIRRVRQEKPKRPQKRPDDGWRRRRQVGPVPPMVPYR